MQIQRKMTDLLEGLDYTTAKGDDATITGLAFRSDKVTHGDLFFCIPGFKSDGHAYAPDAVSRGCAALVVKRKLDLEVPQFIVENPRKFFFEFLRIHNWNHLLALLRRSVGADGRRRSDGHQRKDHDDIPRRLRR